MTSPLTLGLTLFACLFCALPSWAGDAPPSSRCGSDPAATPDPTATKVRWVQDEAEAKEQAARKEHPLMVFQLLGDLDQEFC